MSVLEEFVLNKCNQGGQVIFCVGVEVEGHDKCTASGNGRQRADAPRVAIVYPISVAIECVGIMAKLQTLAVQVGSIVLYGACF